MQLFLRRFSLDHQSNPVVDIDIEGSGISKEQSEKGQIVIAIIMLLQGSTNIKNTLM